MPGQVRFCSGAALACLCSPYMMFQCWPPFWSCMDTSLSRLIWVIAGELQPSAVVAASVGLRVPQHCQLSDWHLPAACLRVCGKRPISQLMLPLL